MTPTYIDIAIPEAKALNYSDIEEICGYQMLLCKLSDACGGFNYPRVTSPAIRQLESQGLIWLQEVRSLIDRILGHKTSSLTLADIPGLLASYDILHRICNGAPCYEYLRRIRLAAVDRWLKGDKSISSTAVALLIAEDMEHDISGLDRRYTMCYFLAEEQWVNELIKHGRFIGIPLCEAYDRLRALLKVDLPAYIDNRDQTRIKSRWVENCLLDDTSTLDLRTHRAYISLLRTAIQKGYHKADDPQSQYIRNLSTLSTRPDLHPFCKEAIRMELGKYAVDARV